MSTDAPTPARLTVLLFAGIRQTIGADRIVVELALPATVADLRRTIAAAHPGVGAALAHCRVAIDREFARDEDPIDHEPGAAPRELALIPPVSGGAPTPDEVREGPELREVGARAELRSSPLSLSEVVSAVSHRDAGGITTFTGNVREHSRGKVVRHLEYEAYAPMAVATMDAIALAVEAEIEGARVALQHRVGRLEIGETAVVIAASAPHRDEAFRACREVIERLKKDVPIWKKEVDRAGGEWIGQGP